MTQEELDKLAEKYQDDNTIIRYYGPGNGSVPEYNKTMAEVFKDGWNACKEQMMRDAVECKVFNYGLPQYPGIFTTLPDGEYNEGDKVRIIIVRED